MKIEKNGQFFKVDDAGIAYGWAIVCTENGDPYTDLQGDQIPESVMVDAAVDFAANSRVGKDMHTGDKVGDVLFVYPITKESAIGLGLSTTKTGLLVGFKPSDPALLEKIRRGDRAGFSIGGTVTESDGVTKSIAKGATESTPHRRTFRAFKINEISLVDHPAMEGATVGYVKRAIAQRIDKSDVVVTVEVCDDKTDDATQIDPPAPVIQPDVTSTELSMPTIEELQTEIVDLKAKLADATKVDAKAAAEEKRNALIVKLSGVHKGFLDTMTDVADKDAFLAKSTSERDVAVSEFAKKAAVDNEIVHTSANGDVFRKKDDPRMVALSKANDALVEKDERNVVNEIAKSALGNVSGDADTHAYIVRSIRKGGGDAAMVTKAIESLTSANAFAKTATRAAGVNPGTEATAKSFDAQIETIAKGIALEQKVDMTKARGLAWETAEGMEIYGKIEAHRTAARAQALST